uniref:Uncharacterized protein n=1 Tax=Emiliania huxleyi TaxID=2903 RepID=A0A7S3RRV7_EMIHU
MPAAAIDAVATVAAGLFYTQSLLPLWLFNLRVNGRWDGLVLIFSTDETAARRAVAESTFSANRTTVVRLTTVSSRRHQPRRQQEYVSLKTRIFDMVPAEFDWVERLLVLDTDIMATRRLRAFLSGVAGGVMEVAWPRSGRCDPRVEVVVPAERPTLQVARWLRGPFALGSPSNAWGDRIATHLNTAVQLQHRRCSARCLARWASASASPFSQEDHPGRGLWQASPHVHSPALPTGELFSSDQDGLNALSLTRQCTVHALDDRSQLYACLGAWSTLSQRGAAASAAFWFLSSLSGLRPPPSSFCTLPTRMLLVGTSAPLGTGRPPSRFSSPTLSREQHPRSSTSQYRPAASTRLPGWSGPQPPSASAALCGRSVCSALPSVSAPPRRGAAA